MPAVRYMKWGRQGILTMIRRIAHESRPDPESPLKGAFTCRTAHELHLLEVPFSRASCAIWPTRAFGKTASPQPRPSSCDYGLRDIRSAWTTNAGWWRLEGRKTAFPVKGAVLEYAVGCRMVHKDLIYEILSVVEEIPEGCVATYGQIARLIGRDKNSRLVGKVLSMAEYYGDYPCHRVVNHAGRLVPGWLEQRLLLEAEQVVMKDDSHVDLKKCQWDY